MNQKNFLILLFALILGVLVDYLFYAKQIGISFFVFILVLVLFSLIIVQKFKLKITKIQLFILIAAILFSAGVFIRSNFYLTFFNVAGTLFLLSLFFILFQEKELIDFNFSQYLISPFSFIKRSSQDSAKFIGENLARIRQEKKLGSPKFYAVLRGVLLAFPILALLIWLLSSADIVFQKYLEKFWQINLNLEIFLRLLIILVSFYFFVGFFLELFAKKFAKKEGSSSPEKKNAFFLGSIESFTVLGLVNLLFLAFIAIQFVYLFGGKTYVWGITEYITYSEYAKKGFGELIAVSIISFGLIYGLDKFAEKETPKEKRIFKILGSVLVLEIFVIMASAFTRLSLYVDSYGFTLWRLFGFIFLFWLLAVFLLLVYKIFSEQKESRFLFSIFWLTILFWLGINVLNPDGFVAKKNLERYIQGKKLDIFYLRFSSDDAISEVVKIFEIGDKEIKNRIWEDFLFEKKKDLLEKKKEAKWQSFNLSGEIAFKEIEKLASYQEVFCKEELNLIENWQQDCLKNFPDEAKCPRQESISEKCKFIKWIGEEEYNNTIYICNKCDCNWQKDERKNQLKQFYECRF